MKEWSKRKNYMPWTGALIGIIMAGIGIFLISGYRLDRNFSVVKTGSIIVEVPEAGAKVYLDERKKYTTGKSDETVPFRSLSPGRYSIIVAKDGFWPWSKEVEVSANNVARLRPFLIPTSITGFTITEEDPEYEKIRSLVAENSLPSAYDKKVSGDGLVAVWVEGKTLKGAWQGSEETVPKWFCSAAFCTPMIEILRSVEPIRSVSFYEQRNDVLVVTAGKNIFAIDISENGKQNYQPIYSGTAPRSAESGSGTLFIQDNETLIEISL